MRDAAKAKTNPLNDREQNKTLFIHSSPMQVLNRPAKVLQIQEKQTKTISRLHFRISIRVSWKVVLFHAGNMSARYGQLR